MPTADAAAAREPRGLERKHRGTRVVAVPWWREAVEQRRVGAVGVDVGRRQAGLREDDGHGGSADHDVAVADAEAAREHREETERSLERGLEDRVRVNGVRG